MLEGRQLTYVKQNHRPNLTQTRRERLIFVKSRSLGVPRIPRINTTRSYPMLSSKVAIVTFATGAYYPIDGGFLAR